MSFSLVIFHAAILLVLVPRQEVCGQFHDGCWPMKYLLLVLLYVASWFISQGFFVIWGHICRGFSILYLFVQSYFLMNIAYLWNEKLLAAQLNSEDSCYARFLLIGMSALSTVGSAIWLAYCFYWFWGCALNNFILIETALMCVWFLAASLLRLVNINLRENYNIFVCSIVTPYLVYLCWSSLASLPDEHCNKLATSSSNTVLQIVIGTAVSALTVISIAVASQTSAESRQKRYTSTGAAIVAEQVEVEAKPIDAAKSIFPVTIPTLIFQVVMVLTSFYFGMLFLSWGDIMSID